MADNTPNTEDLQNTSENTEVETLDTQEVETGTPASAGQDNELPNQEPLDLNLVDIEELHDPLVKALHTQIKGRFPEFDFNQAVGDVFAHGSFDYVNAYYIQEVAGDAAPLVMQQLERIYNSRVEYTQSVVNDAHAAAGGEEQWDKAVKAFHRTASPHIKKVVQGLIDSNEPGAHKEAVRFILDQVKQTGSVDTKFKPVNGTPAGVGSLEPISESEYRQALLDTHKIRDLRERHAAQYSLGQRRLFTKRNAS